MNRMHAGRPDLPPFLGRSLLLAVKSISTIPHILLGSDNPAIQAPIWLAGLHIPSILENIPSFCALVPAQPAPTPAAAPRSAARSGQGRASKAGDRRSDQGVASGSTPQVSQEMQELEAVRDLIMRDFEMRSTLDLRGLVHACWCGIHHGALLAVKYEQHIAGWPGIHLSDLLRACLPGCLTPALALGGCAVSCYPS
jgi:hypothetical protein